MAVEYVKQDGKLYALICSRPIVDGIEFFTPPECEMQLGVMDRPAGYTVRAHQHASVRKTISGSSEFLYLESGSAEYTVFDESWHELARRTLGNGDFALSFRGGHELTILEETRIIEVKQGPAFAEHLIKLYPADA